MSFLIPCRRLGLAALALLVTTPAANAQFVFVPNDTTFDATNPLPPPGTAVIGYANFDDYLNGVNATSPTIRIVTGADVNALETHNSSVITMSGGSVGSSDFLGKLLASDTSTINLSGGNVLFDLDVQFASTVNFSDGTIGDDIVTHDNTTVNMSGGTVEQDLLLNNASTFNLRGGSVLNDIFVQDDSVLNLFGTGLSSVLTDPNFEGFYSEYTLAGHLQDGTDLTGRTLLIQNDSSARFTLTNATGAAVPEPGTLAFTLGVICCGAQWHSRRKKPFRRCS